MNEAEVKDFERERRRLIGLGYRMLGSIADAEDLVQETYLRWERSDRTAIREPAAWLSTTMTRLCIDTLRSRASRRESYVGPWLPEPVQTAEPPTTAEQALELADDLSVAFLLLLERLGPEERAAFLLHDVFEAPYPDIAQTLGKSAAAVRQMVSRARGRLSDERPRYNATHAAQRDLAQRFYDAVLARDGEALLELFKPDATLISDGGGKALAALRPIYGADKIIRFFLGLARKPDFALLDFEPGWLNDAPGYVMRTPDRAVFATVALEADDGRIAALYLTRNPDKLGRIH